jgi:hypothetical protein
MFAIVRLSAYVTAWDHPEIGFNQAAAGGPVGLPVCIAATEAEAESRCRELEREARRTASVGLGLHLPEWAGEDAPAAVAKAGLPPLKLPKQPSKREKAVKAWWKAIATEITPEQNALLWDELFPGLRFYAVVPLPLA